MVIHAYISLLKSVSGDLYALITLLCMAESFFSSSMQHDADEAFAEDASGFIKHYNFNQVDNLQLSQL